MYYSRRSPQKFRYYSVQLANRFRRHLIGKRNLFSKLASLDEADLSPLSYRLKYYAGIDCQFEPQPTSRTITQIRREHRQRRKQNTYFLDLLQYLDYFDDRCRLDFEFGDIIHVPDSPKLVKSRPIEPNNKNSVLMKFNKVRHFNFVTDPRPFRDKKNQLIWRGKAHQQHRKEFLSQYHQHPLCDVGEVTNIRNPPWKASYMSVQEQLKFKFVLSIEGNDVATNLKWILSSNSLCLMTRPKYETWFMEGTLIPGIHYVELAPDYSDLEDKLSYYSEQTEQAERIISNANAYCWPFMNQEQEDLLNLLVLIRYFQHCGQQDLVFSP